MNMNVFRAVRLRERMSQAAYADYLGISESTVAAIETQRRPISATVRSRLAEKIQIDSDLLAYIEQLQKVNTQFIS